MATTDLNNLKGQRALVTGATSGIGRAVALQLARDGAKILVHGRDAARRGCDLEADDSCTWIRSQALGRAAALKEDIERVYGRRFWVQAVVVLWSQFEEGVYEDEKCVFVHGKRLSDWLGSRQPALAENVVEGLTAALQTVAVEARDR